MAISSRQYAPALLWCGRLFCALALVALISSESEGSDLIAAMGSGNGNGNGNTGNGNGNGNTGNGNGNFNTGNGNGNFNATDGNGNFNSGNGYGNFGAGNEAARARAFACLMLKLGEKPPATSGSNPSAKDCEP